MSFVLGKVLGTVAVVGAILNNGTSHALAASLDEIKTRGTLIVATEDSYKPFEFVENGKPMGLDHELLTLLRKEARFKIVQQIIPWTGLLAGVATG